MNNIITSENLSKIYRESNSTITVLSKLSFKAAKGSRTAIVGPSGSGKSTLLHILGGLDKASEGKVYIQGTDWQTLSEKQRCILRNRHLGFVYQFHHLLPEFSALENVAMPLLLADKDVKTAKERALLMLDKVGLSQRTTHKPSQLSGGERQRVAIARALVHEPDCLLADEPTGNLDQHTALKIFELMLELNTQLGSAIIIVTHDLRLAEKMDRVLRLEDGILVE